MPDTPLVKDFSPFDARADADLIYSALYGRVLGTKENVIIDILTHRSVQQRQQIASEFQTAHKKDLKEVLKAELGTHMTAVVSALFLSADVYDAMALHQALHGEVTDEDTLIEIICTRNNAELMALRDAYTTLYQRDVVEDFTCKSTGDFRRLLMALVLGIRDEAEEAVDPIQLKDQARNEAQLLYDPILEKLPTSQVASNFVIMFANPSYEQLRMTLREFEKLAKTDMEKVITRSLTGNFAAALLAIVKITKNKDAYFADEIFRALQKMGSEDERLTRLIISRSEKDLATIKKEFEKLYKISLDTVITGDNAYNYRSVLAALVRG